MIGNISKSKGFKGDKGDVGDVKNLYFDIDENGDLYCTTEYVPSLKTAPYIDKETGNWYVFDGIAQRFYDTGVDARGSIPKEEIEAYIYEQTALIRDDVNSIWSHINNESHFRGYYATNAEIESSNATPNDFTYSAESGTVWVYADMGDEQYAWTDTGDTIPSQSMKASDGIPLINGEAQAGESNEYARGDHRHPTDTTRLSVQKFNEFKDEINEATTPFIVYIGNTGAGFVSNRTVEEIYAAYQEGKRIIGICGAYLLQLISAIESECLFLEVKLNGTQTVYDVYDGGVAVTEYDYVSKGYISANNPNFVNAVIASLTNGDEVFY